MSRVYFVSPSDDAELRGSERAYMGSVCGNLLVQSMNIGMFSEPSFYKQYIPMFHYLQAMHGNEFVNAFSTWLSVGFCGGESLRVADEQYPHFTLALNTALVFGNDVVKLMARLHGQCEIHTYVEGPNRKWLAGIMRDGRSSGLLRSKEGWEDVIKLLESRDDEPVVTSYSVCESFPNRCLVPKYNDDELDTWDELSCTDQWNICMENLRSQPHMEMKPDDWQTFRFGNRVSGFELYNLMLKHDERGAQGSWVTPYSVIGDRGQDNTEWNVD